MDYGHPRYCHKYINKEYYFHNLFFFFRIGEGLGGLFWGVQKRGGCAFRVPMISNVNCFSSDRRRLLLFCIYHLKGERSEASYFGRLGENHVTLTLKLR